MRVVMGNGEVKEDLTMKVTLKLDLKVDRATGILETGPWQPSEMEPSCCSGRAGTQPGEQETCAWMQLPPYSCQQSVVNNEPTVGF